ncbi:hypothetical protein FSPOR_8731 [Fusarium sporotrichioides]|uniref:Uncharacterized protein n=1 Tax=Fusarium sporotrichioides TaxID=5514 RepID=A0A395RTY0_FUSSP|nr:hypothetical protein FSPOR_8731 [Fusarium sporotrichioides]
MACPDDGGPVQTSVRVPDDPLSVHIGRVANSLYPATLPGPEEDLNLISIYYSQHYAAQRPAQTIVKLPHHLAASEIVQLAADLMKLVRMYHHCSTAYPATHGDFQHFLAAVFFRWQSDRPIGEKPVLQDPSFDDRALHVGYLKYDLEPVAGLGADGLKNRHEDDKAYVYVYFDYQTRKANVVWKDANCLDIRQDDVSLIRPFRCLDDRITVLFKNYEQCERIRIMDHNWELAIWSAREKIKRFAETGVTTNVANNWPDRLETEDMEPWITVARLFELFEPNLV